MRYEIKQLDLGGILDQAIQLTTDNFWLFLKIAAVLMIPFGIISGLLIEWNMPDIPAPAQPGMFAPRPQFQMPPSLLIMISVIGLLNLLIIYPLTDAAMIHGIASRYLERPIGVAGAYSRAIRIILPLIGTWILMMLVIAAPIAVGTVAGVVLGPAG